MPSVVPWRFLLNPLNDSLTFYTTFRQAVVTGVWSNLSVSGRERYLKGASFHLQYRINDLDLETCINCFNSIYHNKIPLYLALKSIVNRCFTLLNTVDISQWQFLELPQQIFEDYTHENDDQMLKHLLVGEIIYKLSSLHGIYDVNASVSSAFDHWLNNFGKINDKRHLLLSIFMCTNANSDSVIMTLTKYIAQLTSESFDNIGDKYLLMYIIAKLSHVNSKSRGKFNIYNFTNYIQDVANISADGINDTIKCLALESISLLRELQINMMDHDSQINKLIATQDNNCSIVENSEYLLQMLVNYNIKSSVLWEKFQESYKKKPIPNLALYLLDSYINYRRKHSYFNESLPLEIADRCLVSIKNGMLSKFTSNSKDSIELFLQMAKKYRQMIKGRIVKVEPCGLYVEIPTNDASAFAIGYVDIATFPNTFEERLDSFFVPENHFHVRITSIPPNYDNKIKCASVVNNQVLMKSSNNLISLEPANLDFDTNAVKKSNL